MKVSRTGLKPIPESKMSAAARIASQAHRRATKMNGAEWSPREAARHGQCSALGAAREPGGSSHWDEAT
jgi:hypothetical protein